MLDNIYPLSPNGYYELVNKSSKHKRKRASKSSDLYGQPIGSVRWDQRYEAFAILANVVWGLLSSNRPSELLMRILG